MSWVAVAVMTLFNVLLHRGIALDDRESLLKQGGCAAILREEEVLQLRRWACERDAIVVLRLVDLVGVLFAAGEERVG